MARGRPLAPLVLTDNQLGQLTSHSQSTSMPHGLVQRARIVLACADGLSNKAVDSSQNPLRLVRRQDSQGLAALEVGTA